MSQMMIDFHVRWKMRETMIDFHGGWILYGSIILLLMILFVLKVKYKKHIMYLFFFTIMYIYLCTVINYTQFPIYALPSLRKMVGLHVWANLNLVPLLNLTKQDFVTSILNVLMTIPFGFGLPFITKSTYKKIVVAGLLIGVISESLQGIIGLLNRYTLRIVDINDVIFNFTGTLIGFCLFKMISYLFKLSIKKSNKLNSLVKNLYDT
ncbi:VanZ family protein [Gottfriedia luciferensis]|uniref:VanZ family protein n=1 Tax=Gottfriedia luciferensis TaxID=178774 RepID=UPI0013028AF5|nr:VanZ family protein [Gottfriedia luciferensis]